MRCSIVYSDKVATPPVITANTVWKEFKSTSLAQWFNKFHVGLEVMG